MIFFEMIPITIIVAEISKCKWLPSQLLSPPRVARALLKFSCKFFLHSSLATYTIPCKVHGADVTSR